MSSPTFSAALASNLPRPRSGRRCMDPPMPGPANVRRSIRTPRASSTFARSRRRSSPRPQARWWRSRRIISPISPRPMSGAIISWPTTSGGTSCRRGFRGPVRRPTCPSSTPRTPGPSTRANAASPGSIPSGTISSRTSCRRHRAGRKNGRPPRASGPARRSPSRAGDVTWHALKRAKVDTCDCRTLCVCGSACSPAMPGRCSRLLRRRDLVGADHLAPQPDLARQQGGPGLRRLLFDRERVQAPLFEPLAHGRVGERMAQRGIEPVDDRPRRAGRRQQHVPEIEIELGVAELAHGGQVGQAGEPCPADDGVALELAGLDQRPRRHRRLGAQIGDAAEQVVERRPGAAIGHLRDRPADLLGKQHAGKMTERAGAGTRQPGVPSGLVHPFHQPAEAVRRQRRPRRHRRGGGVDRADGDEVLFRVEADIRIERHPGGQRHLVQQHRVPVRRGAGGAPGGDHAAGAADILDDDLLPERLREAVLHDARDRVGGAAGRIRHDERDRARRPGLRRRGAACEPGGEEHRGKNACEHHLPPSTGVWIQADDADIQVFPAPRQDRAALGGAAEPQVSRLCCAVAGTPAVPISVQQWRRAMAKSSRPSARKPESRFADVNGTRLHYLAAGSGESIVVLHGYAQTSHMWRPLMAELARTNAVIAPDLRGFGDSAKPDGGYDKKTMAQDIHALAHSLGWRRVRIAGHDIGLMVAYAYAAQYPDEVDRIVLMDAFLPGVGDWTKVWLLRDLWHFHFYGETPLRLVAGRERIYFEHFWNDFAADRTKSVSEKDRRFYARAYHQPGAMRAGFEVFRSFEQDARDFAEFARTRLTMPMLVL